MASPVLPLGLRVTDRDCILVGAGEVALRKAMHLIRAGARLRVISLDFLPSRAVWERLPVTLVHAAYQGLDTTSPAPFLVVAATDSPTVNAQVVRDGRALGALVARVDAPEDGDFVFPATLRRGRLTVSFSTDGLAPRLSGYLKRLAERQYDSTHAALAEVLARLEATPPIRALSAQARRAWFSDERLASLHEAVQGRGQQAAFAQFSSEAASFEAESSPPPLAAVSLVGAGPGAPDLLTLRAVERLASADVVVHDELVSEQVMDRYAPQATRIGVGKRKGRVYLKQEALNALLVALARSGLRVVRLKGGDPCVFGRAEEERLALDEAGIGCELVPGVSALHAVPAAAGIVVTNRSDARSLGAFSLHKRDGSHPDWSEWQQMAHGPDTLVLFMGKTILAETCKKLIQAGRAPNTPAVLIVNGTLPDQRVVRRTLATLPEAANGLNTDGPGLIVVGAAAGHTLLE